MSTIEINLYNILKSDFHLSDAKAMNFINSLEKLQEETIKSPIEELSSKMDARFEQINTKFEQVQAKMDLRFEQVQASMNLKFEQVYTKIESTNANTLKWFMGGFVTIVLMILASIFLKT